MEEQQITEKDIETRFKTTIWETYKKYYSKNNDLSLNEKKAIVKRVFLAFKENNVSIHIKGKMPLASQSRLIKATIKECLKDKENGKLISEPEVPKVLELNDEDIQVRKSELVSDKEDWNKTRNFVKFVAKKEKKVTDLFKNLDKKEVENLILNVIEKTNEVGEPIDKSSDLPTLTQMGIIKECIQSAIYQREAKASLNKSPLERSRQHKAPNHFTPHIYLLDHQIQFAQKKWNKETRKEEFVPFIDSRATMEQIKEGKAVQYVHILLPKLEDRIKIHGDDAYRFGIDSNGIDRDDPSFKPYIQIPIAELREMTENSSSKLISEGFKPDDVFGIQTWYINNTKKDFNNRARFNIYFTSRRINGAWVSPERIKDASFWDLQRMFAKEQAQLKKLISLDVKKIQKNGSREKKVDKDHTIEKSRNKNKNKEAKGQAR